MARYKEYSYEQTKLIPIAFFNHILPGTFEHTLNHLIDQEFDLSVFGLTSTEAQRVRSCDPTRASRLSVR